MKEIIKGASEVKGWIGTIFFALAAFALLTALLGGGSTAALLAVMILVGAEIILRRRKKKAAKFGEVARGSEVEDHTNH